MKENAYEDVDCLVVGSGFGGAAVACRVAQADRSVLVLERGKRYPPGSFPRLPHQMATNFWDPSEGMYGLFDLWSFRRFEAVVASGLGGGSLIYANVMLRKPESWFPGAPGGTARQGLESWPISYRDLVPGYERAEQMLGATPFPFPETPKSAHFQDAAKRAGLEWHPAKLAVSFGPDPQHTGLPIAGSNLHGAPRYTCRMCGQCDLGCNFGSKNTTDLTYLSVAVQHGARVEELHEVRSVSPHPDGGWTVEFVRHDPEAPAKPPVERTWARTVVLSAGTFGSTYLLLSSRARLPRLSPLLGSRFSGNGDYLGFVTGAQAGLDASSAPVITGMVQGQDVLDGGTGRGFFVQDGGYPLLADWLSEATGLALPKRAARVIAAVLWARITRQRRSRVSARLAQAIGDGRRSEAMLPLLGMGRDRPEGVMRLAGDGDLDIDWSQRSSKDVFDGIREAMGELSERLGGRFRPGPSNWLSRMITVHPLGGCPMGRTAQDGVVDDHGEVHGYPGLFVADGSVLPGPAGANPSLTIAALAERFAERVAERSGR